MGPRPRPGEALSGRLWLIQHHHLLQDGLGIAHCFSSLALKHLTNASGVELRSRRVAGRWASDHQSFSFSHYKALHGPCPRGRFRLPSVGDLRCVKRGPPDNLESAWLRHLREVCGLGPGLASRRFLTVASVGRPRRSPWVAGDRTIFGGFGSTSLLACVAVTGPVRLETARWSFSTMRRGPKRVEMLGVWGCRRFFTFRACFHGPAVLATMLRPSQTADGMGSSPASIVETGAGDQWGNCDAQAAPPRSPSPNMPYPSLTASRLPPSDEEKGLSGIMCRASRPPAAPVQETPCSHRHITPPAITCSFIQRQNVPRRPFAGGEQVASGAIAPPSPSSSLGASRRSV